MAGRGGGASVARAVQLSPSDQSKLLLAVAGMIARDRRERGVKLNQPEAVALLSCWVIERAREGRSVADLMAEGRSVLAPRRRDGRRAGARRRGAGGGDVPGRPQARDAARADHGRGSACPGELVTAEGELELNAGRETKTLRVMNTGDRPIQVGSHFHFAAANDALDFDREAATGFRLDVPAGTSVRFEPGAERDVDLVALGGTRTVPGLR